MGAGTWLVGAGPCAASGPYGRRRVGRLRGSLLCVLACVAALLAGGSVAQAAPATVLIQPSCATPAPGQATCFDLGLLRSSAAVAATVPSLMTAHHLTSETSPAHALSGHGPGGGYSPSDLTSAYALPPSPAGTGQTVAVVDAYGDPNAASDLATYRSTFKLPPCTTMNGCFTKVDQRGGTNYPTASSQGWIGETSLDLDMVSATCPACHILLVEADDDGNNVQNLLAADNEAVALGATEVSNSWGIPEFLRETFDDAGLNHPGVPIIFSAGDVGYGADYPAASPNVTAVGGTTLTPATNPRGWSETVWANTPTAGYGTGGGCSVYEAIPAWQQASLGCATRLDNDVSAVADPDTGVSVYDSTQDGLLPPGWSIAGGTSASAPIVAATDALSPASARTAGPSGLYSASDNFFDVTSGSNCLYGGCTCPVSYECNAGSGYDGPTGWGTPDGPFGGVPSVAQSAPRVSTISVGGVLDAFYRGANGAIVEATDSGGVWTPQGALPGEWAVGDPVATVAATKPTVYYVGGDGDLHEDVYSNGAWTSSDTGTSGTAGDPSYAAWQGIPTLTYRGSNGDIWWDVSPAPGSTSDYDTATECGSSGIAAAGDPVATVTGGNTGNAVLHIYFVGTDGDLHTATFTNSTASWSCSSAGQTGAVGDPSYVSWQGNPAVAYRGSSQHVWVRFGTTETDATAACAGATAASGDPLATVSGSGVNALLTIYYVGVDGDIHQETLANATGTWSCSDTGMSAYNPGDLNAPGLSGFPALMFVGANSDVWQGTLSGSTWSGSDIQDTVTGVSPAAGPSTGGNSVVISGSGLAGATAVYFGATAASFTASPSGNSISVASVPAGAGTVDVTVVTPWGTTPVSPADQYTYQPVITAAAPSAGSVDGGGFVQLTLSGVSPSEAVSSVSIGGTPTTWAGYRVFVPAGVVGTAPISMTFYDPAHGVHVSTLPSAAGQYTYLPAPAVTQLSTTIASTAGGTSVTLTGTGFTGATQVMFGSVPATTFTVNSATSITATSPPQSPPGLIDITVTTPGGTSATGAADQLGYSGGEGGTQAVGTTLTYACTSSLAGAEEDIPITLTGQLPYALAAGQSASLTNAEFGIALPQDFFDQFIPYPTTTSFSLSGINVGVASSGTPSSVSFPSASALGPYAVTVGSVFAWLPSTPVTLGPFTPGSGGALTISPGNLVLQELLIQTNSTVTYSCTPPSPLPTLAVLPVEGAPTVTGVSPNHGAGGTAVRVTGTNLTGASAVHFGSRLGTILAVNSATSVTVLAPSGGSGTVDVTVTTQSGTNATSAADHFTY